MTENNYWQHLRNKHILSNLIWVFASFIFVTMPLMIGLFLCILILTYRPLYDVVDKSGLFSNITITVFAIAIVVFEYLWIDVLRYKKKEVD